MKRYLLNIIAVASILLVFSCDENSGTIGVNFINSNVRMVYTDTLTVKLSSFKLDSVGTSGKKLALVGRFNDEHIGSFNSKSYIVLKNEANTIDYNAVYDSIFLEIKPTGYFYGDTSSLFTIKAYEVTEIIETSENSSYLFNTSEFAHDIFLGEKTFLPRPKSGDKIMIPINDDFGRNLVELLRLSTTPFEHWGGFQYFFKGLALESGNSNSSILGFSLDTLNINLYYHIEGVGTAQSVSFSPTSTDLQFNQISIANTGSPSNLLTSKPLPSELLNNHAFVQGGTGIFTRIDFPYLKDILLQERSFVITKARLVIQPSLVMNPDYLPSSLYLYGTNKFNDFLSAITNSEGTTLNGSLHKDDTYPENTNYSWDITSFIKILLNPSENEFTGLTLLPKDYDTNFDHVIVNDQIKSQYKTKLELYMLYYE